MEKPTTAGLVVASKSSGKPPSSIPPAPLNAVKKSVEAPRQKAVVGTQSNHTIVPAKPQPEPTPAPVVAKVEPATKVARPRDWPEAAPPKKQKIKSNQTSSSSELESLEHLSCPLCNAEFLNNIRLQVHVRDEHFTDAELPDIDPQKPSELLTVYIKDGQHRVRCNLCQVKKGSETGQKLKPSGSGLRGHLNRLHPEHSWQGMGKRKIPHLNSRQAPGGD